MDEKQFIEVINANKGILVKICRSYFDNPLDQEDLFQEIIIQLWKSIHSFKGHSKLSSWIYRVALNTALVYFKKESKKVTYESLEVHENLQANSEENDKNKLDTFYRSMQHLSKVERAIILLFIDGYSGEEIAGQLGLSPGNVRVKTNRSKKKLKELIKNQGNEF